MLSIAGPASFGVGLILLVFWLTRVHSINYIPGRVVCRLGWIYCGKSNLRPICDDCSNMCCLPKRAGIVLAASLRRPMSVCLHKISKTRSWCNLVVICAMVNARSGWKLVRFDLDIWLRELFSYFFIPFCLWKIDRNWLSTSSYCGPLWNNGSWFRQRTRSAAVTSTSLQLTSVLMLASM